MIRIYLFLFLLPVFLLASARTEYSKLSNRYHKNKHYASKLKKLRKDFLNLAKKYPNTNESNKAYYTAANLSYKLYKRNKKENDLDISVKYFSMLCKNKKTYLADDACMVLYTIYTIYRKDNNKSLYYAKYIIRHYPKSDSYEEAKDFIKRRFPNEKILVKRSKVKKAKEVKKVKNNKKSKYIIVLDPGHGGNDPGARGKMKKSEKDLVLDVALLLEKKLKKNKNYKVILTRRTDKYISLDDRTDIANKNKGDIFISIHINALSTSKYYGIETFYLNLAADNYSRRLERVENAEHQKKISDLQFILADLLKKANTKDSIEFAKIIQSTLVFNLRRKYKNIRNLGVKNAMFYVLLDTKMPSILVELGFITNSKEEKRLNNKKYQDILASSLKKGIDNYFVKHKKDK